MAQQEVDLDDIYQGLVAAFSNSLNWNWDDYIGGALAEFAVEDKEHTHDTISKLLNQTWDSASIGGAPRVVRDAMETFGGLHSGQLLFTTDTSRDVILLGLWWPWGDGTTISIRFVPYEPGSPQANEATQSALKLAFGL